MKTRNGFVSNSSSSSFIVNKEHLTNLQRALIKNHIKIGEMFGMRNTTPNDAWTVVETGDELLLRTDMDNFDMRLFLETIDVPARNVKYGW